MRFNFIWTRNKLYEKKIGQKREEIKRYNKIRDNSFHIYKRNYS